MKDEIIMVKKRTADGRECRKCVQMTKLLEDRGVWTRITRVAWAEEAEPESEGMQLGRQHRIDTAPFFIVRAGGRERPDGGERYEQRGDATLKDGHVPARISDARPLVKTHRAAYRAAPLTVHTPAR